MVGAGCTELNYMKFHGEDAPRSDKEIVHDVFEKTDIDQMGFEDYVTNEPGSELLYIENLKNKVHILKERALLLKYEQPEQVDLISDISTLGNLIQEFADLKKEELQYSKIGVKTEIISGELEEGEEWKKGTEHAPTHKLLSVEYRPKTIEDKTWFDKIQTRTQKIADLRANLEEKIEKEHPDEYLILETLFLNPAPENRTN